MATTINYNTCQEEIDPDVRRFLEHAESRKPTVELWKRIKEREENNNVSLAEEMETTHQEVKMFVDQFEAEYKTRLFRRGTLGEVQYKSDQEKEDEFKDRIELGNSIMKSLCELMELDKQKEIDVTEENISTNPNNYSIKDETVYSILVGERIRTTTRKMLSLMTRFARVLESEGIHHNLPVKSRFLELRQKEDKTEIVNEIRNKKVKKRDKFDANKRYENISKNNTKYQMIPAPKKIPLPSASISSIQEVLASERKSSLSLLSKFNSPIGYLQEYADRCSLFLEFRELVCEKSLFPAEHIYRCKLHTITGEGNGKMKSTAKQNAACEVMKLMMKKQKSKTLPLEMSPLSKEDLELATSLICESEDYELALLNLCSSFNARPPIYSPLMNVDVNAVRCKALGMNAIGRGKSKKIARRVAAKLLLDLVHNTKKEERLSKAF